MMITWILINIFTTLDTNNSNDNSNSIALLKRVESLLINLILYI